MARSPSRRRGGVAGATITRILSIMRGNYHDTTPKIQTSGAEHHATDRRCLSAGLEPMLVDIMPKVASCRQCIALPLRAQPRIGRSAGFGVG
jgi:hypothetical protein